MNKHRMSTFVWILVGSALAGFFVNWYLGAGLCILFGLWFRFGPTWNGPANPWDSKEADDAGSVLIIGKGGKS